MEEIAVNGNETLMKNLTLINKLAGYIHKDPRNKHKTIASCKCIARKLLDTYGEHLVDTIYNEIKTYKNYVTIEVMEAVLDDQEENKKRLN